MSTFIRGSDIGTLGDCNALTEETKCDAHVTYTFLGIFEALIY